MNALAPLAGELQRRSVLAILDGDARAVLAGLPDNSVQACVTSPPYFNLRDYQIDGQIGLEPTPDEYVQEMVRVFREVRRVLREDGLLFLNLGDSYAQGRFANAKPKDLLGIPWMVAFALRADGWYLRSSIIWAKNNPMPESCRDRPTSAHENVFMLAKSPRYFYDAEAIAESAVSGGRGSSFTAGKTGATQGGRSSSNERVETSTRNARNVWTINTRPFKGAHFATMPVDLARRCVEASTSPAGCCAACRAPLVRVIEKGEADLARQRACGADAEGQYAGQATKDYRAGGAQNASDVKRRILEGMVERRTVGFRPTCGCGTEATMPCLVLDPFGGAGTTLLAAQQLGRDGVAIELNPDYAEIARQRLGGALRDFIWRWL